MQASNETISRVLRTMRRSLDRGRFLPINRPKNTNTLDELGLTWEDAKEELKHLTPEDYTSGPDTDWNDPDSDQFWIFKKQVQGETIYIKFKVEYQKICQVRVVSFHLDEPECRSAPPTSGAGKRDTDLFSLL